MHPSYSHQYRQLPDDRLLDILDNPADYLPEALADAKAELERRDLSNEALSAARQRQLEREKAAEKQSQQLKAVEDRVKAASGRVLELLNPLSADNSAERIIRLSGILLAIIGSMEIWHTAPIIWSGFQDLKNPIDAVLVVVYSGYLLLLPFAALMIWRKKLVGWVLAVMYSAFSATHGLMAAISELAREPSPYDIPLDNLFPHPSIPALLGSVVLYGGLSLALCRTDVREIYRADNEKMLVVLLLGAGFAALELIPGLMMGPDF